MKNTNVKHLTLITTLGLSLVVSACSKQDFSPVAEQTQLATQIPVDPVDPVVPVTPPPVVIPPPVIPPSYSSKLTSGVCAQDSSTQVLSCLKCDVPQIQQQPQLSAKAQALMDIMYLACQVPNKSDYNNFRPTKEMILKKLNQASNANYPDSVRTSQMELVVQGLSNPNDDSLRKHMFGGLWYHPPYSDAFETYFGLTVREAKATFCWYGDTPTPAIAEKEGYYSKDWLDCQYGSNPFGCVEKPAYVAGKKYRQQLDSSLKLGITNPYVAPIPDPQKKCTWDKFSGDDLAAAKQQLKKWKAEGRKVSMTVKKSSGVGLCGDAVESNISEGSTVEIATYKCE